MSMSTKIEDLPGPPPIKPESSENQSPSSNQLPQVPYNATVPTPPNSDNNISLQQTIPESNVKAEIKKRVRFSDKVNTATVDESQPAQPENFISSLRAEINEENLIMTFLFFVACHPSFSKTVTALPVIGSYLSDSGIVSTALKAVVLFVVFVLLKIYTLPYVRL